MLGSRFDLIETVESIAAEKGAASGDVALAVDLSAEADIDAESVELEREMMKVAASVHSTNSRITFRCPICDERMTLRDETPMSEFGSLDVKLHKLDCSTCGMATGRVFHPAIGYRDLTR